MYLPSYFNEPDVDVLHALMRDYPLATLVTTSEAGLDAIHVPVETQSLPAPHGLLRGHIARANPLWRTHRTDQEVLAIFHGPNTYITPSFYLTKLTSGGKVVPTWDYAVVHARGILSFTRDAGWLHDLVARLTDAHEAAREKPWKVGDAPHDYVAGMLSAIVGFELTISSLVGKWKVSQNRSREDQAGVIAGLRADGDAQGVAIADFLEERGAS